ncbi:MAG: Nif3-like dinuclear metal center hexameric protein [Proteobacteria bacterium]|nr:Nif3-like dinuclear metal center hexameric protein [Burkholderiales bacterium]
MHRQALADHIHQLLDAGRIDDYCPNGLQVEGRAEVRTIVTGVTASLALIEAAVALRADALLVHHGLFWRGDSGCLTGYRRARVACVLAAEINLYAYHLPLDIHLELGNNTQLGHRLGIARTGSLDAKGLIALGSLAEATALGVLGERVATALGRQPLLIGDPARPIARVGWCTGAGQRFIEDAWPHVDAFITGEVSEQTVHVARECGVALIGAGHHATERYGVQALGAHLAARFGLEHRFVDIDNPA